MCSVGLGVINGNSGRVSASGSLSVLIVDDEWIIARGVQKTLEVAGYEVTGVASSAHDALLSVDQRRPDLALVDIVIATPEVIQFEIGLYTLRDGIQFTQASHI